MPKGVKTPKNNFKNQLGRWRQRSCLESIGHTSEPNLTTDLPTTTFATRKSYFKKLQTIHNQGLRLNLGAFRTSLNQSLYIKANEPPLTLWWEKLFLQYALKLQSSPDNPTHQKTNNSQFNHFYSSKPFATSPPI